MGVRDRFAREFALAVAGVAADPIAHVERHVEATTAPAAGEAAEEEERVEAEAEAARTEQGPAEHSCLRRRRRSPPERGRRHRR